MSTLRRIARPVDASLRTVTRRYSRWLEKLIHAIKNEIVGRLDGVDARLSQMSAAAESSHTAIYEQLSLQGAAIRKLTQEMRADASTVKAQIQAVKTEIDESASGFLNYANSHAGPLADAGLWINHPVSIQWEKGRAEVGSVNERIIEHPFVFSALADLRPGSRILDVGGGESTVAVALASSGFQVTVVEPMGYPFSHPNLSVFEKPLEQFEGVEPFDAVVALSSIEHFGIAHYDIDCDLDLDADTTAIASIANLLNPGGRLVLTTPFGPAEVTDVERIYDEKQLRDLLAGWTIHHVAIGRRLDDRTWELETNELAEPAGTGRVAMLVATPPAMS